MEGIISFGCTHNKKGKYHLVPREGEISKELCGTTGVLLHSGPDVELISGKFYDVYTLQEHENKTVIEDWQLDAEYCKKCIKKAMRLK